MDFPCRKYAAPPPSGCVGSRQKVVCFLLVERKQILADIIDIVHPKDGVALVVFVKIVIHIAKLLIFL